MDTRREIKTVTSNRQTVQVKQVDLDLVESFDPDVRTHQLQVGTV